MGGIASLHRTVASGQRGVNGQPGGRSLMPGTLPGSSANRADRGVCMTS
jgi:hypothetical protein